MKHIEVHYHFVHEWVLSSEVELRYVHTDHQVADIFTKALGTNKLQHFLQMLLIQHLHVPHMRGTTSEKNNNCDNELEQEPAEGKTNNISTT